MSKKKKKSTLSQKNRPKKTKGAAPNDYPFDLDQCTKKYLGPVLICLATIIMAWWSWGTWCDPMIDFGRELYIPWQISEGKTLYTDIAYFNGPFSPYFNSIGFLLLGVHLRSLYLINFLLLTALLFFGYQLLRRIGTRLGSTLGCVAVVTVFAFAKYHFIGSYNYMAPYSHEMTHGLLLSIIGIWCLSNQLTRGKTVWIFFSGIFSGLVFLTKIEFTVALMVALISGYVVSFWVQKESWRQIALKLGVFILGTILPIGVVFLLLNIRMPASQALTGILGSWAGALTPELRDIRFYRDLMGLNDLSANIQTVLVSSGCLLLLFTPAITLSMMRKINEKRERSIGVSLIALIILLSILLLNTLISVAPFMLRPLPLVLFSLIILQTIRIQFRGRKNDRHSVGILRLTLLIFSLLLLLKIILKVDPSQYGFALSMPAVIITISTFVDWLPSLLKQKGRSGTILQLFSIAILTTFIGIHILWSGFWYSKTQIEIKTDTASFNADFRGKILKAIIEEIKKTTSPTDTLAVLPEGAMLNFLTQRENPTPYINFMPPEFILFGEAQMLESFKNRSPDYILLTNKSLEEYGMREVGVDIGVQLYQWIEDNYSLIKYIKTDYKTHLPFTHMRLLRRNP